MRFIRHWLRGSIIVLAQFHAWPQVVQDAVDPNGVAMPYRLVKLVHSRDVSLRGTTADLRTHDPYLLYQLGRDLVHHQFKLSEGLYGRSGELSVPLYIETYPGSIPRAVPARFARDHTSSCDSCHSMPAREPGAGQTIASTGPLGRNTPHFYGAGLVEMLCEQIRRGILAQYDRNGNGRIDRDEIIRSSRVSIAPSAGAPPVDFGQMSTGSDGVPRLNPLFRIWYLDVNGNIIPDALSMKDLRVAAFNIAPQPFGWGRGYRLHPTGERTSEGAEASTIRSIFTLAADLHMGLQAHDPTQRGETPGASDHIGGLASVSLNGAQQYDFGTAPDLGRKLSPQGLSLDDGDADGKISELIEGDVDAAEFYMLNSPAPAIRRTATSEAGRNILLRIGCARCHVENWVIRGRDDRTGWPGDRRIFDLRTATESMPDGSTQIVGHLVSLAHRSNTGKYIPLGRAFTVRRIYTDFKHWDIGPAFYERRHDGTLQQEHRTAPLWGIGSTAPYGHSGQFPTLHDAIAAHAGEARKEGEAYTRLSLGQRSRLLEYLDSLVLYSTSDIPVDLNGDGIRSANFAVAGQQVGFERFDPRFLFSNPPQYHRMGWGKTPEGYEKPFSVITNVSDTYRTNLPYRRDSRGDGFPDVLVQTIQEKR